MDDWDLIDKTWCGGSVAKQGCERNGNPPMQEWNLPLKTMVRMHATGDARMHTETGRLEGARPSKW